MSENSEISGKIHSVKSSSIWVLLPDKFQDPQKTENFSLMENVLSL